MTISIIDSLTSLYSLLDDLEDQPTNPPSLYLDIEGVKLSRHGSISIIQIFHLPKNQVFLIDIFVLQESAFNTPNQSGTTLRSILESSLVPKVFFDVRNDSDALYAHFGISLEGVHDVQLLEVATRSLAKDKLNGLANCIRFDTGHTTETQRDWIATKERGRALFAPEDGGSYEVFNTRPFLREIIDYCAQDVVYLPFLWNTYTRKISKEWLKRVQEETRKRVLMSQAESYEPHGKHKGMSPWARPVKERKKNRSGNTHSRKMVKKRELAMKETEEREVSGMKEIEEEESLGMADTVKTGGLSIPLVTAAQAAHRKAEKQPSGDLIHQLSALAIKPQAPKPTADTIAGQVTPLVVNLMHERRLPLFPLPLGSKGPIHDEAAKKMDVKTSPAAVGSTWKCTTCNRSMQKISQRDHLAGKAHMARLKQVPSTVAKTALQPTTAKDEPPKAAAISTTGSQKAKVKPVNKPKQGILGKKGPKSTKSRSGAASTFTYSRSVAPHSSGWGFVGFEQKGTVASSVSSGSSGYDSKGAYHFQGGDCFGGAGDYGACDKDCGWCGRCMDGIDI